MFWLIDTATLLVIIVAAIFLGLCGLFGFDPMLSLLFGQEQLLAGAAGACGLWQAWRQRPSEPE